MVHTDVYYLSQRTHIVLYREVIHRKSDRDGPRRRCAQICLDTRGSFDDRDREGLRLLSPVFQQRVLKLQRDLEEAKVESRYFRARRLENPVVAPNRP